MPVYGEAKGGDDGIGGLIVGGLIGSAIGNKLSDANGGGAAGAVAGALLGREHPKITLAKARLLVIAVKKCVRSSVLS